MENDKRALSWQEFVNSGFDGRDYKFPDFEGTYNATIVCKRWGASRNLIAYCIMNDGRKVIATGWSEKNYLGLADIPVGTQVKLTFQRISPGKIYLKRVERTNMG